MRVLIVEDEPHSLELCRTILEMDGHDVVAAADGPSGLSAAARERPDLIVLDVMLPGLDGLSVLGELRRNPQTRGAPVILLTARARVEDEVSGLEAGADAYVRKPYSPVALSGAVSALGGMSSDERDGLRNELLAKLGAIRVRMEAASSERRLRVGTDRLSATERRVAQMVSTGSSVEEACRTLGFAPPTFWSHTRAIRRKLGVPRGIPLRTFLDANDAEMGIGSSPN